MASSLSTPARRNCEQLALHVVARGGVGFRKIERGERVVDVVIERDGSLGGAGLGEHGGGVIAEGGVGMDLLHESGEVAGGVVLADGLVERDESVFDGARAFDGEQSVDGALAGGEAVGLDFFEGGDVGLGGPDCGLRDGDLLGGEDGRPGRSGDRERLPDGTREALRDLGTSKFLDDRSF